ncbi:MAG: hypothetical protein IJA34_11620 [Lachnospiraceae bacterium]|nr:hypothetical protein [Lachnospiraceae bacterium]
MKKIYIKIRACATILGALMLSMGLLACGANQDKKNEEVIIDQSIKDALDSSKRPNGVEVKEDEGVYIGGDEEIFRISTICTEEEGAEPLFDTTEPKTMIFTGNSLLNTPQTDRYFKKLVEEKGNPLTVVSELYNGSNIKYHLDWLETDEDWRIPYAKADIILFQEYGGYYDTTYENICEIIDNYCKENVLVYYYTTEFDSKNDLIDKITKDERMHVIDYGTVMEKLNCLVFEGVEGDSSAYEYLHQKNDYHPNMLNGFLASAYIYNQLYKTSFDYTYDMLDDNMKEKIPGETDEDKIMNYNMMLEVINKGVTQK